MKIPKEEKIKIENDGYLGQGLFVRIGILLIPVLKFLKISPNQVTIFNMFVASCACFFFALPAIIEVEISYSRLIGTLLLLLALILDFVDGTYARITNQTSPLGSWLDTIGDFFFRSLFGWMGFAITLNIYIETLNVIVWLFLFIIVWSRFILQKLSYWKPADTSKINGEWNWKEKTMKSIERNLIARILNFIRINQYFLFGIVSLIGFLFQNVVDYGLLLTITLGFFALDYLVIVLASVLNQGIDIKRSLDEQ